MTCDAKQSRVSLTVPQRLITQTPEADRHQKTSRQAPKDKPTAPQDKPTGTTRRRAPPDKMHHGIRPNEEMRAEPLPDKMHHSIRP
jgi:hypothetical protein